MDCGCVEGIDDVDDTDVPVWGCGEEDGEEEGGDEEGRQRAGVSLLVVGADVLVFVGKEDGVETGVVGEKACAKGADTVGVREAALLCVDVVVVVGCAEKRDDGGDGGRVGVLAGERDDGGPSLCQLLQQCEPERCEPASDEKCPVVEVPFAARRAPLRDPPQHCEHDDDADDMPAIAVRNQRLHDAEDHQAVGNPACLLTSSLSPTTSCAWASTRSRTISSSTSPSSSTSATSMPSIRPARP